MATVTMVRSDYSDKPLSDDDNPVKVKLTVKVGTATGESFDLDFSEDEVEEFLERIRNRKIRGSSGYVPKAPAGESEGAQIRKWCKENNIEVNARGAIPADIKARWEAENNVKTDSE